MISQEAEDQDDSKKKPTLNDDSGATQDTQAARGGNWSSANNTTDGGGFNKDNTFVSDNKNTSLSLEVWTNHLKDGITMLEKENAELEEKNKSKGMRIKMLLRRSSKCAGCGRINITKHITMYDLLGDFLEYMYG